MEQCARIDNLLNRFITPNMSGRTLIFGPIYPEERRGAVETDRDSNKTIIIFRTIIIDRHHHHQHNSTKPPAGRHPQQSTELYEHPLYFSISVPVEPLPGLLAQIFCRMKGTNCIDTDRGWGWGGNSCLSAVAALFWWQNGTANECLSGLCDRAGAGDEGSRD